MSASSCHAIARQQESTAPQQLKPYLPWFTIATHSHPADWDGDGRIDFLLNGTNADWLQNTATRDGLTILENRGPLATTKLDAHDTSPTTVDWHGDGRRDLVVGAEDGYFYYLAR
jgi:hypothetical protein